MPITQNDVRLYASERMTDFADGGGRMSPTVIVDGQDNNVFPDVTDIDRLTGRVSLRKVFGAVTSADNDTYLSAHALLDDAPDDAATSAVVFTTGGLTTERAEAVSAFEAFHDLRGLILTSVESPPTGPSVDLIGSPGGTPPAVGQVIGFTPAGTLGGTAVDPAAFFRAVVLSVATVNPPGAVRWVTVVDRVVPSSFTGVCRYPMRAVAEARPYGVGTSPGAISSGATTITVSAIDATVVPYSGTGAYPTVNYGIDPAPFEYANGKLKFLRPTDAVLVHSTVAMSPATVSNGQTVNTLRTDLARLRVIGNNGVEHARFTKGITPPTGVGCTANLTAGTVTFTDVSGLSQPVTVEHRIEEMVVASSIAGNVLTLNRALSRAYPAGTKVSSLLMLGDLRGRVEGGFAQQAWTGVWADARIGGEPSADFNDSVYPITTTNQGAITQRWYILFTSTTAFRVIGEFVGEIASGNTGAAYAPINPSTGVPYFTIPPLGWGTGWAAGNVWRFNTVGAQAPIWALRCVAPSVPGGNDSVTVEFRGYVNA